MRTKWDKKRLLNDPTGRAIMIYLLKHGPKRACDIEKHIIDSGLATYNVTRLVQYRLNDQMKKLDIVEQNDKKEWKIKKWWYNELIQCSFSELLQEYPSHLVYPFVSITSYTSFFGIKPDLISKEEQNALGSKLGALLFELTALKKKQVEHIIKTRWEEFEVDREVANPDKMFQAIVGLASQIYVWQQLKNVTGDMNRDTIIDWIHLDFTEEEIQEDFPGEERDLLLDGILFLYPVFSDIYPINVGFFHHHMLPYDIFKPENTPGFKIYNRNKDIIAYERKHMSKNEKLILRKIQNSYLKNKEEEPLPLLLV